MQIWSLLQPDARVLRENLHTHDPLTLPVFLQIWTPAATITHHENVAVDGVGYASVYRAGSRFQPNFLTQVGE